MTSAHCSAVVSSFHGRRPGGRGTYWKTTAWRSACFFLESLPAAESSKQQEPTVRARRHPAGAQHAEVEERGRAKEERVHGLARSPPARARASERAPVSRFGRALKRGEALTWRARRVVLGDARGQTGAALFIALLPVLACADVVAVPASGARAVSSWSILAPPRTVVLELRVPSARGGRSSARSKGVHGREQGVCTAWKRSHQRPRTREGGTISAAASPRPCRRVEPAQGASCRGRARAGGGSSHAAR